MKKEIKISTLSIVCVICAAVSTSAYAASSVRTLGGAGTYNSAASASASGAGVARAGSVRLSPTATHTTASTIGKPVSLTTSNTATAATPSRTAGGQRLSLGKYMGGNRPISISTPGTSNPGLSSDLENRVTVLEDKTSNLEVDVAGKQIKLTNTDHYIDIDEDGTISLLVDNLKTALSGAMGGDSADINIRIDGDYIQWQHVGDGLVWHNALSVKEIFDKDNYYDRDEIEIIINNLNTKIAQNISDIAALQTAVAGHETDISALNYAVFDVVEEGGTHKGLVSIVGRVNENGTGTGLAYDVRNQGLTINQIDNFLGSRSDLDASFGNKNIVTILNDLKTDLLPEDFDWTWIKQQITRLDGRINGVISDLNAVTAKLENADADVTMGEDGLYINDDVITSDMIIDGQVKESDIDTGAVTQNKIGAGAVVKGKLGTGAVQAGNIDTGAVQAGNISDGAVQAGNIDDSAVLAGNIAAKAVQPGNIDDAAVVKGNLAAGAVQAGNIDTGAVQFGNIAKDAIENDNIKQGEITWDKLNVKPDGKPAGTQWIMLVQPDGSKIWANLTPDE